MKLEVVERRCENFEVLSRHWYPRKLLLGVGLQRCLSKNYERLPEISETVVHIVIIPLMLQRPTA
ncbi:MAG: hypothetical protein V7L21_11405 [Nostoc sp.]|uniref:hypothetical protein n=1 Tax=Nostoc sp. TaxID=1180 RepID=UPI002FFC8F10